MYFNYFYLNFHRTHAFLLQSACFLTFPLQFEKFHNIDLIVLIRGYNIDFMSYLKLSNFRSSFWFHLKFFGRFFRP